jgi:hypothetical protein
MTRVPTKQPLDFTVLFNVIQFFAKLPSKPAETSPGGDAMKDRIELLERTILDLGAEVYKLKHALVGATLKQQAMNKLLEGLRGMLDEKGLITQEEIEEASIMSELVDQRTPPVDNEPEKLYTKKGTGH